MPWPLSQDYNETIQSPAICFADPELRQGKPTLNPIGVPLPWSGNFADVYRLNCPGGRTWAIKCFTREVPGLRDRYREISAHLRQAELPFMVDFQFLEQGIRVRGQWYPVVKMHWIEGLTLNEFVGQQADNPRVLEVLSQIWQRLALCLRDARMAHADLQHGNVLLVPGSTETRLAVKLIDYDGMWVPALARRRSGEAGHPAYQHPQRLREGIYSAEVDRFSHLVIYTALRALMVGGRRLWNKYDNGDNLLFRQQDLQAPERSPLFAELMKLNDPVVRKLTQATAQASRRPLEQAPLLDDLVGAPPPAASPGQRHTGVAAAGACRPGARQRHGPRARWLAAAGLLAAALIGMIWFLRQPALESTIGEYTSAPPARNWPKVEPITKIDLTPEPKVEPGKAVSEPAPKVPEPEPKTKPPPVPVTAKLCDVEDEFIGEVNKQRAKEKLPPCRANTILMDMARGHSLNMARQNRVEHRLNGRGPLERAEQAGYPARLAEQVFLTAAGVDVPLAMATQMKSPDHRDNILDANWIEIGVAVASNGRDAFYTLLLGAGTSPPVPDDEIANSIGIKLKRIPAGKFTMGSPLSEVDRDKDEGPQHEVEITRPFYMGACEVTQEEYERVMGSNPSHFSANADGKARVEGLDTRRFPVERVSWNDAVEFCRKMSELPEEKKAGRTYRLPTEAEWEYACRGGKASPFHHGASLSSTQANFDGNHPYGDAAKGPNLERTATVGSYLPNAFGLYDVHGNVREWCADWYDESYYQASSRRDPLGPDSSPERRRLARGGAWNDHGWSCRAAKRHGVAPGIQIDVGLRVVCVVVSKTP